MKKLVVVLIVVLFLVPVVWGQEKYTVKEGDWLITIAGKYNMDWQTIYQANQNIIDDPNLIFPGQVLDIPVSKLELGKKECAKIEAAHGLAEQAAKEAGEAKRLAEVAADQAEINLEKSRQILDGLTEVYLQNPSKKVTDKVEETEYNSDITFGGSIRHLNDKEADFYFNFNNVLRGCFTSTPYMPGEIKYTPLKFQILKGISIDPLLVGLADYNLRLGRNKSNQGLIANFDPRISAGVNIDIEYKNFLTSFDVYGPTLDIYGRKWLETHNSETLEVLSEYKFNKSWSTSLSAVYLWNELGVVDWFYLLNWYKGATSLKAGFGQRYHTEDRQFEVMLYASRLFKTDFFKQLF